MSPSNEDQKPMDNMELLKQQASDCAPGCDCHAAGPLGRKRLILGTIVLLVAVALVARAVIRTNTAPSQPDAAAFTSPIVAQTPSAESAAAASRSNSTDYVVAKEIAALSELNTLATANDAVFVYVPGKDGASSNPPATAMKSAVSRIGSQGYKIGVFTLKAGTRDHESAGGPDVGAGGSGDGQRTRDECRFRRHYRNETRSGVCGRIERGRLWSRRLWTGRMRTDNQVTYFRP